MRKYHHEIPGPFSVLLQILTGAAVGVLIAGVYLVLKPVKSSQPKAKDAKEAEVVVERNVVTYTPGNPGNPNGQQWRVRERAVLERAPAGVALSEQDINRWISSSYGEADRTVKVDEVGLVVEPELPLCRISGSDFQVAMVYRCKLGEGEKSIVAQARGTFVQEGERQVFTPKTVYLGSCPLPGRLGTMLVDKLSAAYPVPDDIASAWKAVKSASVEENTLKLAFN